MLSSLLLVSLIIISCHDSTAPKPKPAVNPCAASESTYVAQNGTPSDSIVTDSTKTYAWKKTVHRHTVTYLTVKFDWSNDVMCVITVTKDNDDD